MILNESNFEEKVLNSKEPVLVDFFATWCGPCVSMNPLIEEISATHSVGKVNIDENPDIATRYGISAIPTFMVFKDGKPVKEKTKYGIVDKETLLDMLNF